MFLFLIDISKNLTTFLPKMHKLIIVLFWSSKENPPPYPGPAAPYPTQAGPYPTQAGPYPTQAGPYPTQAGPYPGQTAPYPGQTAPYPTQAAPSAPPSDTGYFAGPVEGLNSEILVLFCLFVCVC